ncbi:hypothetical protein POUND7_006350 [Theobroma cacao]
MMSEDTGESTESQEQFFWGAKVRVVHFTFDQEASRKELARAIIMHEYPLSIVDDVGFRKYSASLQPLFEVGSRKTLEGDILKIYDFEKAKLRNVIEGLNTRFAITTEMWTSKEKKGYMSVIAHYIDDSWVLQSRMLRFIYVPIPRTMDVIAQNLMDALMGWNIETKLSTITVENCTSGDGMLSIIVDKLSSSLLLDGKIVHVRCFAHVVDLVVKDGLSLVENAIERMRDSVAFWSATPSRVDNFEAVARQAKISSLNKLGLDCKTCWKSTYLMLKTAIWYKDLFPKLLLRDEHYTCVPTDDDWKMGKNIAEKLACLITQLSCFLKQSFLQQIVTLGKFVN